MPKGVPPVSLHIELAELYERARRAVNEAHILAADRDLILWWCAMRPQPVKPPSALLDK